MLIARHAQHQAPLLEVGDERLRDVLVLDEAPLERTGAGGMHARVKGAVRAHRVVERLRPGRIERDLGRRRDDPVVVLAECRRQVHDARALLR